MRASPKKKKKRSGRKVSDSKSLKKGDKNKMRKGIRTSIPRKKKKYIYIPSKEA